MNKTLLTLAFAGVTGPALALADGAPARVQEFVDVMVKNHCVLPEKSAAELLPAAGFTRDEAQIIVKHLRTEGRMNRAKRTLYLTGAACETPQAIRAGSLQVLSRTDCQVAQDAIGDTFAKSGLPVELVTAALRQMVTDGDATFADAGQVYTLNSEICS
ncbi:MAG: hypothetical protein JXR13_18180 [Thalassovita sp.]